MMRYFFLLIILNFILSCSKEKTEPDISFYHWQSYFDITKKEYAYMDSLKTSKMYLRYFDIGMENKLAQPLGKILLKKENLFQGEIVPTIFITNSTFIQLDRKGIDDLVIKVWKLIQTKHEKISSFPVKMTQFDCDWSGKSKENYFYFLRQFKSLANVNISTTIRLHQVKYKEKTGVPPSDHFVLMCYNTGSLKNIEETNSILDIDELKKYRKGMDDYPFQLELALPIFSWGVLYRDRKVIKLLRNVSMNDFSDKEKFTITDHNVLVQKSTYLNGYYLYKDDVLRLERIDTTTLIDASKWLSKYLDPQEIIFYHLDHQIIQEYEYQQLENIRHIFSH